MEFKGGSDRIKEEVVWEDNKQEREGEEEEGYGEEKLTALREKETGRAGWGTLDTKGWRGKQIQER